MKNIQKLFASLVIALMLSLAGNTYAQDASNDATWEETIEFLKSNNSLIVPNITYNRSPYVIEFEDIHINTWRYSVSSEHKYQDINRDISSLAYKNILSARVVETNGKYQLHITTVHNAVTTYIQRSSEREDGEGWAPPRNLLVLPWSDRYYEAGYLSLLKRYEKALNHVAYLNKKKSKF